MGIVSGGGSGGGPVTQATTPWVVSGAVATGGLTDAELRATPISVSGTLAVNLGLTDTQLRATPVPVSGTVATGGLTDTQLRASAIPVSGTFWQATQPTSVVGTVAVDGSAVTQPVSAAALPLPGGAATEASLAAIRAAVNETAWQAILAGERL